MGFPSFATGEVLTAADMNAVGLWLVKTQTIGSAVSSQEVTGAFSSTYDNYLITISGGTASTNCALMLRLGAANTGYAYSFLYTNYASTPLAVGTVGDAQFTYAGSGTSSSLSMYATLQNPNLADHTFIQGSTAIGTLAGQMSGYKADTTQYTAFTILTSAGTMTGGTIRVYGYRN